MKLKIAVILCMILITVFGSRSVYAAGQQQENVWEIETPDATDILPSETESLDSVGASLPEKKVTVEPSASTEEIQEMLDLNKDGTCKLELNIPAGEYHMTKTLYINPNTTIIASSGAKIVKSPKGAILEDRLTNDDGGYDGNHDITVQGGIWDGTPYMGSEDGTELLRFIHCSNITVKNAKLCNISRGHLLTLAGVKNAEVSNCEFSGYGTNPSTGYLTASTSKEAVHLDVVHSTREVPSGQNVYYDDLTNDTITIKNCKFHEFPRGVGTHTAVAGMMHNNVVIENNTFSNLSDTAIRLYNYTNSVVRNNTITNAAEGVMIYTYIKTTDENAYNQPNYGKAPALPGNYNITVSGNTIKSIKKKNNTYGNGIRVTGISGRLLKGVKIQNNTISGAECHGIWAVAAPGITISGNLVDATEKGSIFLQDGCDSSVITANQVSNGTADGIVLQNGCSSSAITANKISNGKTNGISISESNSVTVYGNTVTSVSKNGIYLRDSDNCTIGKSTKAFNTIQSAGGEGIAISRFGSKGKGCIGTRVLYNQITASKKDGIYVSRSEKTTIRGNTVKNSASNGIFVNLNSKYANILRNNVQNSSENGIALTSASKYGTIRGNTVTTYGTANKSGSKYGIIVYNSGGGSKTNTVIRKNKITGAGKKTGRNAIHLSSSSYVTVSGNTINKADGSGIYLYKSKYCTIGRTKKSANTIKDPKEYGIYVISKSLGAKVQYNKISGAKTAGIGVYDAKRSTVKGNTIASEKDGIKVTMKSSLATISNNTITSAGATGIWLSNGSRKSVIRGNTIKKYAVKRRSGNGIYIYQSGGTGEKSNTIIASNRIIGTGKSVQKNAISVNGSAYTTLKKNTIKNATGIGIYIFKSRKNTIEGNKIIKPRKHGIYLSTNCGKAIVKSNTITKAGDVSIMLYGAPSSSVTSNKVTGSKKYKGIWANKSNKTTIKLNTVKGTKKTEAVSVMGSLKCKVSKNKRR